MIGDVTIVCGPTAVGKGSVVAALRDRCPQVWVSISVTTRPARPGEVDGVHYHFIDDAAFDELIAADGLLEWALVHRVHRYGTPSAPVEDAVAAGRRVILEIDLQGARQVRAKLPGVRSVFIAPPRWETLRERLLHRGTEDEAEMDRRLQTAQAELAAADEFDHIVVNDDFSTAVDQLVELLGL